MRNCCGQTGSAILSAACKYAVSFDPVRMAGQTQYRMMTTPVVESTYQTASGHIAEYVLSLEPGCLATTFETYDELGRKLKLEEDYLSGRHLVLVFLNSFDTATNLDILKAFSAKQADFERLHCAVLAVSANSNARENLELKRQANFAWPVLGDASGQVFAGYGLHKLHGPAHRSVLLTPLRQVRTWHDAVETVNGSIEDMLKMMQDHSATVSDRWSTPFAPVLQVPNVLSSAECAQAIESFETGTPFFVRPPRPNEYEGTFKVPVYEHNRQDRIDSIVQDKNLSDMLDKRIWGRVIPMIQKAFAFTVTRRELLHIARYAGERNGVDMGHRDNTEPAGAHRRFALSLNLNDDFEGAEIFFKEFSQHGYKPSAGSALVFSSSLLHEVGAITRGTRYVLITNLFNDESIGKR